LESLACRFWTFKICRLEYLIITCFLQCSSLFFFTGTFDKQDITIVSDVYSLGATIYFVLTESFPLDARERISGREQLIKPSELIENISDALDFIIMKSLNLNPDERYRTVYALKKIRKFSAGREIFKGNMSSVTYQKKSDTYQKKDEEILQLFRSSHMGDGGNSKSR
jgi:serine/threonine protein kinase